MRGSDDRTTARARLLRKSDNDAEAVLWSELRNCRLNGHKFVRQLPIGPYFADFACREERLVIELDGSQHVESGYDRRRDRLMVEQGWSVLRFWNVDALLERDAAVDTILAALEGRLESVQAQDVRLTPAQRDQEPSFEGASCPSPLPSPREGRGEGAPTLVTPSPCSSGGEGEGRF